MRGCCTPLAVGLQRRRLSDVKWKNDKLPAESLFDCPLPTVFYLLFFSASRFNNQLATSARITNRRLDRRHIETGQRHAWCSYLSFSPRSIDNRCRCHYVRATRLQRFHSFTRRASRSHDVFHHQQSFTRRNREAASQDHLAVLALSPDEPCVQSSRYLVPNYQTADCRRSDSLNVLIPEVVGQAPA